MGNKSRRVIKAIYKIYPSIQGGFTYWETQENGTPHVDDIDGLRWSNSQYEKPSWQQILANLDTEEEELILYQTDIIKQELVYRTEKISSSLEQKKILAEVVSIHNKELKAIKTIPFLGYYQLTPQEKQILLDAEACRTSILAVEAKANSLLASLSGLTLSELKDLNPREDSHWE